MDQLTSAQISEWEAVDRIDPIGPWREDFRFAKIESLLTNIVNTLYCKKGHTPVETTPLDFMIDWAGDGEAIEKVQTVEQMKQTMLGLASSQNKKVVKKDKPPVKKQKR